MGVKRQQPNENSRFIVVSLRGDHHDRPCGPVERSKRTPLWLCALRDLRGVREEFRMEETGRLYTKSTRRTKKLKCTSSPTRRISCPSNLQSLRNLLSSVKLQITWGADYDCSS